MHRTVLLNDSQQSIPIGGYDHVRRYMASLAWCWPNSQDHSDAKLKYFLERIRLSYLGPTEFDHLVDLLRRTAKPVDAQSISRMMISLDASFGETRRYCFEDAAVAAVGANMAPGTLIQIGYKSTSDALGVEGEYRISPL